MTPSPLTRLQSLALGSVCAISILALDVEASPKRERSHFGRLSLEQGLSQNYVTSILQDEIGFIWLGTEDGLNRYDGYRFEVYYHDSEDARSLSHGFVHVLYQDRQGGLWVGTEGGLDLWDPATDTFQHFRSDPSDASSLADDGVWAILEDSYGNLWIGTEGGLHRFYRDTQSFVRFLADPNNPASLSENDVRAIFEDREGVLWIGTNGGGLDRLDRTTGFFIHHRHDPSQASSLSDDQVRALAADSAGRLWVGTYGGGINLMSLDGSGFLHLRADPTRAGSLSDDRVSTLFRDRDGTMWVGTEMGLNEWDEATGEFHHEGHDPVDSDSLSSNLVRSLYQDRGGILWVGTRTGGVNKRDAIKSAFRHFYHDPTTPSSLSNNVVTSFQETRDGSIWVGTFGGGLNRFDPATGAFDRFRHDSSDAHSLSGDRIMSLGRGAEGELWVGTFDAGLNRFDPATGRSTRYPFGSEHPGNLSEKGVSTILLDRSGQLWVGTYGGGLNLLDRATDRFRQLRHDPANEASLGSDRVTVLFEDSRGVLWVGTEGGGLNRFDPATERFARYVNDPADPESLSSNVVWSIYEDRAGTLWVSTQGGGLNRVSYASGDSEPSFTVYRSKDGLPNDFVYGILEDDRGNLWLSSNSGLAEFDPRIEAFRVYDASHGLQSNEFNFGAYFRTASGQLLFGGINGFNAFYPRLVPENTHPPRVVLTELSKFNEAVALGSPLWTIDELELGHRDHLVSFAFAALDFTAPEKNAFRYKLEGFNDDWIDLGTFRRVSFTNLHAGRYALRVQGSNNDGVWSDQELTIRLRVRPAPWASGWAFAVYALTSATLVALSWTAYHRARAREARYLERLENEVAERTRELKEGYEQLARLNHRLEESSVTDSLTGLRNRRFVFENIEKETSAILRANDPRNPTGKRDSIVFFMLDLDGYKEINDTHGHDVGDRVLQDIRKVLEDVCRTSDILVRWGGDEFLVIGRVSAQSDSEVLAERIRSRIASHPFAGPRGVAFHTTCSIGFACFPFVAEEPELITWQQVLTFADRALYVAKENGRNAWVGLLGRGTTSSRDLLDRVLHLSQGPLDENLEIVASFRSDATPA